MDWNDQEGVTKEAKRSSGISPYDAVQEPSLSLTGSAPATSDEPVAVDDGKPRGRGRGLHPSPIKGRPGQGGSGGGGRGGEHKSWPKGGAAGKVKGKRAFHFAISYDAGGGNNSAEESNEGNIAGSALPLLPVTPNRGTAADSGKIEPQVMFHSASMPALGPQVGGSARSVAFSEEGGEQAAAPPIWEEEYQEEGSAEPSGGGPTVKDLLFRATPGLPRLDAHVPRDSLKFRALAKGLKEERRRRAAPSPPSSQQQLSSPAAGNATTCGPVHGGLAK
eukprot:CAMPEP_0206402978 /NCGR_PEP_ID=MMETSP0294-20121207/27358_1 /ASSEMBLY_ACC=CAM_ASM_000327 /TAXON_ID=39354 /ORGANISM="Heterosigma akashiwo, Strain CCMP2393" /LENGTH=276 /DNA_ID=CAMNT_0053860315 /DNA_START=93 /DNA_END=920 /DNA_ORIENTATION=+